MESLRANRLLAGGPAMGQEVIKLVNGMSCNAGKHIAVPGPGIDLHPFAGCHEGPEHSCRLTPGVAAKEGPVIPVMYTCT